jgi:hypothetical protein
MSIPLIRRLGKPCSRRLVTLVMDHQTGLRSPARSSRRVRRTIKAEYSTKVFTGFRSLGDQEIDSLAEAIVREVKVRAPFFGLSDFVNRRLTEDPNWTKRCD